MSDEVSQDTDESLEEELPETTPTLEAGSVPDGMSPHAVIWVPGLQSPTESDNLASMSRRFAIALDRAADTATATFHVVAEIEERQLQGKIKVRKSTIVRTDGDDKRPMIDLYEVDYLETLLRPHEKANLFLRWWQVTWIAISGGLRFVRFLRVKAKNLAEKLQMVTVFCLLLLMASYAWLLAGAIVAVVDQQLEGKPVASAWKATKNQISELSHGWGSRLDSYLKTKPKAPAAASPTTTADSAGSPAKDAADTGHELLLVLLAILGLRSFSSIRDFIEGTGARYASAIPYIQVGIQRSTLVGHLSAVLEHIEERQTPYKEISLMAYSFGTFIALDSLFPHSRPPDKRFKRIQSLVTIGCPYDLTRAFWPTYAREREADSDAPRRWINVYSPLDVMGSNFRDDHSVAESKIAVAQRPDLGQGIKPENIVFRVGQAEEETLRLVDAVTFLGIRAHRSYWSDTEEGERSCFYDVVSAMYAGEDVLA